MFQISQRHSDARLASMSYFNAFDNVKTKLSKHNLDITS